MGVWLRKFSHRFHSKFAEVRLHKSSHRFHGFAQMAWLRLFSHGIHRIHRSFVALVLPQNSQKFYCVAFFYKLRECSVGGTSLPEGSVCSVRSVGDIPVCFVSEVLALTFGKAELRLLDSGGCVGMAECHTLLHLCKSVLSVGDSSLQETSVRSVGSVGI